MMTVSEPKPIMVTGGNLAVEDVYALAHDSRTRVKVAAAALETVSKTKAFLDEEFDKKIIYGVNTGFGPMASHIVGRNQLAALQKNLIRSHAMGMGEPLPEPYVLAAMPLPLNPLAKGYS